MQKNMDIRPHPNRVVTPSQRRFLKLTKKQKVAGSILAVIGAVIIGFLVWFNISQTSGYYIQSSKFQVVVLSNNQIYFGKLQRLNDQSYRLTNVYYLQEQTAGGASSTTDPAAKADQAASTATPQLVKLGNELHGPDDAMFFNDTQVLYWENLKSDGKVSKAIQEHSKS